MSTSAIVLRLSALLLTCSHVNSAQIPPEPPGYMDCPLCANPDDRPGERDVFNIFVAGSKTLTCADAYDLGVLRLPEENCTFWQDRGSTICKCGAEAPPRNNCKLCEDGQPLPTPTLAGAPNRACALLQVDAIRDDPSTCSVWQGTFGHYCGCNNTETRKNVCRMCGVYDLPNPLEVVNLITTSDGGARATASCSELEFEASLPDADCNNAQLFYSEQCCRGLFMAPVEESEDAATHTFVGIFSLAAACFVGMSLL